MTSFNMTRQIIKPVCATGFYFKNLNTQLDKIAESASLIILRHAHRLIKCLNVSWYTKLDRSRGNSHKFKSNFHIFILRKTTFNLVHYKYVWNMISTWNFHLKIDTWFWCCIVLKIFFKTTLCMSSALSMGDEVMIIILKAFSF